jgi:hypothetical protein
VDLLSLQALLYGREQRLGIGARARLFFRLQARIVD